MLSVPLFPSAARRHFGALCALLIVAAPAAHAQSLLTLFDSACDYDATYQAARALAGSAKYRAEQSSALLFPSVALSGNATRGDIGYPVIGQTQANAANLTLSLRQPLFNRPDSIRVEQSVKIMASSQLDLDTALQALIIRLSQAYFDTLAAQDALATSRANRVAIREQLSSTQRAFDLGNATITDIREAQARYDLANTQQIVAENDLLTKHVALNELTGRREVVPRALALPAILPQLQPPNVEDWVARAASDNPALRHSQLAYEIAQLETDKAVAAHLPTLDAIGQLSGAYTNQSVATIAGTTKSATIGLQFNMPLYSGGAMQSRVEEAQLLQEQARDELEAVRHNVAQTTRQAFYAQRSSLAQVTALEAAESSSAVSLEATQRGYKIGVRVNLDVLNAQNQLFTTRRDLAKARYDVLLGDLKLRQATGTLSREDVVAIDRLLMAERSPAEQAQLLPVEQVGAAVPTAARKGLKMDMWPVLRK